MDVRARPAERIFFVLVAAVLLLNLGATTIGLRLVTQDDAAIVRGLSDPVQSWRNRMHDFRIGRIYADVKFWLLDRLMSEPSDVVHAAIRIGAFLLALAAAAWFTWEWRRSERAAWLVMCAGSAFVPVAIAYQALLSYPLLWLGWAGVWAMGALALRPESAWGRSGIATGFAVALFAHESNAAFLIWPALLRLATQGRGSKPAIVREFLPCAVVLTAYAAFSWWLRAAANAAEPADIYEGAKLSLDLRETILAWVVYSGSGLPGLTSWLAHTNGPGDPLWLSWPAWLHHLKEWGTPLGVIGASLLGVAVWLGTAPAGDDKERPRLHTIGVAAALGFAAFAPNLLLALTVKYQTWAHQRTWPYYYTSMSYLAWVVLLAVAIGGWPALMHRVAPRRASRVVLATAMLIAAMGVGAANREAGELLRQHPFFHMGEYRRWFSAP